MTRPRVRREATAWSLALSAALAWGAATPAAADWYRTVIEPGRHFDESSSRAVAGNSSGGTHAVYGGRVLYHRGSIGGLGIATEVVDGTEGVGAWASIAIDGDDALHVAYRDATAGALRYATNTSGAWVWEVVDDQGGAGHGTSIAASDDGDVHIVYTREDDGSLWYAIQTAGFPGFTISEVDPGVQTGPFPSVAVTDTGQVYVSYGDEDAGEVIVATRVTGGFTPAVLQTGRAGIETSLDVDPDGDPHVVWHDETVGGLHHATLGPAAGWLLLTVDPDASVGAHPSLDIALDGYGHVAYAAGDQLGYADSTQGEWYPRRLADTPPDGAQPSLAARPIEYDPLYSLTIYFRADDDGGGELLAYARPEYFGGFDDWYIGVADQGAGVGEVAAMALDSRGRAHVAYGTLEGPRYASNASGVWRREALAPDQYWGVQKVDVAVDSLDRAHVIVAREPWGGLAYYTDTSGTWSELELFAPVIPGYGQNLHRARDVALDLDGADVPHLVFNDRTNASIQYGTLDATGFVELDFGTGADTVSLAVEDDGTAHVLYSDASGLRYRTDAGGAWTDELARAQGAGWPEHDVRLDASGQPHVGLGGQGAYQVRYLARGAAGWVDEQVDADHYGWSLSFDLDGAGAAHLVYWSDDLFVLDRGLYYATNASGSWVIEALLPDSVEGGATAVGVDPWGGVHVLYHEAESGDLVYQTTAGGYLLEPASVDFGEVYVGSETTQAIQVTNTGNADLGAVGLAVSGPAADDFRLESECPFLAPGAHCVLLVTFAPTRDGERGARIEAADGQFIDLVGEGQGVFSCQPESCEGDCTTGRGGDRGAGVLGVGLVLLVALGVRRRAARRRVKGRSRS